MFKIGIWGKYREFEKGIMCFKGGEMMTKNAPYMIMYNPTCRRGL